MQMIKIGNHSQTKWLSFLLAAAVCALLAGCVGEEYEKETGAIIARLDETPDSQEQIEFNGELIVHSTDVLWLSKEVQGATSYVDRRDIIVLYLQSNKNIKCILDEIQHAATEETNLNCGGKALVEKSGKHGMLGVTGLLDGLNTRESTPAKREFLMEYLDSWGRVQRISRVVASLGQITRTRALPVLGTISRKIHNFPILYEGDVLVPTEDVPLLIDQVSVVDTEDAKRNLVANYLRE